MTPESILLVIHVWLTPRISQASLCVYHPSLSLKETRILLARTVTACTDLFILVAIWDADFLGTSALRRSSSAGVQGL